MNPGLSLSSVFPCLYCLCSYIINTSAARGGSLCWLQMPSRQTEPWCSDPSPEVNSFLGQSKGVGGLAQVTQKSRGAAGTHPDGLL